MDAEISALPALGVAPASGDLFPIVDISDTSAAPTGTTKKITVALVNAGLFLSLLGDVVITSPLNGQVLTYDTGTGKWINAAPAGGVTGSGTSPKIAKWTGATSLGDGSWEFATNDIIPTTTGSNIGDSTHRVGTIFMASTVDYSGDMSFISSAVQKVKLGTNGNMTIGLGATTYRLSVEENQNVTANVPTLLLRNYGDGVSMFTETRLSFYSSTGSNPDSFVGAIYSKFDGTNAGDGRIAFETELSASPFRGQCLVLKNGKVGAGLGVGNSPAAPLHAYATSGEVIRVAVGAFGDGYIRFEDDVFEVGRITVKRSTGNHMYFSSNGATSLELNGTQAGIGYASGSARFYIYNDVALSYGLYVDAGGGVLSLATVTNGDIGIGVNTPEVKLDIKGIAQMRRLNDATGGAQLQDSYTLKFQGAYWTGAVSASKSMKIKTIMDSTVPAYHLSILNDADTELMKLSDTGNVIFTGSIKTAQPSGNGAGVWKLGKLIVAAAALDATQYIEVDVDGVVYKIALIV